MLLLATRLLLWLGRLALLLRLLLPSALLLLWLGRLALLFWLLAGLLFWLLLGRAWLLGTLLCPLLLLLLGAFCLLPRLLLRFLPVGILLPVGLPLGRGLLGLLLLAAQLDKLQAQHVFGFGGDAVAFVKAHPAHPDDLLAVG